MMKLIIVSVWKTISSKSQQKKESMSYEDRYSTWFLHGKDESIQLGSYSEETTGFIECTLVFTESQRNRLKHYPPLPFKLNPEDRNGEHTPYMKGLGKKLEVKSVAEKLIFGVFDLPNYCIYSEMLKYLLENDMCELVKVHSGAHEVGFCFPRLYQSNDQEKTRSSQCA